jgi:uncharacterized protein (TIGR02118 family)
MYRMTILYGIPDDPDEFRRYYTQTHIPIARQMKGLTGWTLSWIENTTERPSSLFLIAELYAESAGAMNIALNSPEGLAASADVANFASGSVEFLMGPEEEVAFA